MFKQEIITLLSKETRLKPEELENLLEIPPNPDLGDYAFPCFILSKREKKSPVEIAEKLVKNLSDKLPKEIDSLISSGPYLNIFINKIQLAKKIIKINANYGKANLGKKKKIAIDFSAPNIGKPMHIGHIRSTIIGDSLMRIYSFLGYNSIGINYLGDIGLHIGKIIVAWELWLNKDALKKDPIAELLRLYVKFCGKEKSEIKPGEEDEPNELQDNKWTNKAKEKIQLLELGDKKATKIWDNIRKASGKGFDKVYNLLNVEFTETTGQSYFAEKGKEIITEAILNNHAKAETSGAVFIEINNKPKYILRSNKTATYMTYDLGAAVERFDKHNFHKMIYVTDYRQAEHFKQLFYLLNLFEYEWADKLEHLGFGTINFGKEIMKTREGGVILLEDVLKKTINKALENIKKRKTKGSGEKVGIGAIKYIALKNEPSRDVNFSWEKALSFEGNTGPYLQYSYARASSIIKKAKNFNKVLRKIPNLEKPEIKLIKKISEFPEVVEQAGHHLNPALIANYSYELAKTFSEFYTQCPVLKSDYEAFRLLLVNSFRTTLKNSLHLLGIEVMEEM